MLPLAALRSAPEFDQAAATAPADPLEHRRAIARALIAHALVAADADGQPPLDGAICDALVEQLTDESHGYGLGVREFLLRPFRGITLRTVTRKLTGDRGAISDAAGPVAGDVLRFLARGDRVRAFIREAIADFAPGPIHLLGHSIGGIMCVDLLIREAIPEVTGLITVGSQASFLYEIGALPSLLHPNKLPDHFPPWVNIYGRRDVLSYVGAELFGSGGREVRDVEIDTRQPLPHAHSAYWTNDDVWKTIAAALK
jgi:pimeloyl-ACP methyl ester carboxylesterase